MTEMSRWRGRHHTDTTAFAGALDPTASPTLADLLDAANTDQLHVLRALLHMSQAVLCARYFDEVLEAVAVHTLTALDAASASVSRWERADNVLRTLINVGDLGPGEEQWPDDETYPVDDDRQITRLLRRGRPYINSIDDAPSDSLLYQVKKESELAVPVMYNDVMWGELWVTGTDGRRFGPDDVQVLQAIAAHMAVAVGRSQLFSAVWRQAFEDPLTGLANRRGLDDYFANLDIDAAQPAIVLCDLDSFKEVNDRRGHPAGDALLCQVADVLGEIASATADSMVARLGGDEFCTVLPSAEGSDAERFARAASRVIAERTAGAVSLSWGVAVFGPQTRTGPALVTLADAALLEAKRLGPGRLSTGTAGPITPPDNGFGRRTGGAEESHRLIRLVPHAVRLLDERRPDDIADALEVAAVPICNAIDAAAWSISLTTEDSTGVRCLRGVRSSRDGASGLRVLAPSRGTVYPLSDYPSTARAIATGEPYLAAVDADGCDPTEVALLADMGYRGVLGVAVGEPRRHLLEIYSDVGHEPLAAVAPYVRVLANHCAAITRRDAPARQV
jgi:diguanylate cyclase (GGDEF)-like protein